MNVNILRAVLLKLTSAFMFSVMAAFVRYVSDVTPLGSVPDCVMDNSGKPEAAGVNVPLLPTVNMVLLGLPKVGSWLTVSVKFWTALGATPLLAVKVMLYVPPVPAAGVPLRT